MTHGGLDREIENLTLKAGQMERWQKVFSKRRDEKLQKRRETNGEVQWLVSRERAGRPHTEMTRIEMRQRVSAW